MMNEFLVLDHVCSHHSGTTVDALKDVSFVLERGEVLSILGSSGAGKTSLLRSIAGFLPLQSGVIRLDDVVISALPVHERGVGLMFQDNALFPHLNVSDNVGFGLKMQRLSKPARRTRSDELLEMVGLAGFGARAVSSLSGGEKQRVALARTLAPSPQLLLLDEPLGALDRVLREQLLSELTELIEQLSLTVLFVTHDRFEATAIANRVAVMEKGSLVQIGTPQELRRSPNSDQVSLLLGVENGS